MSDVDDGEALPYDYWQADVGGADHSSRSSDEHVPLVHRYQQRATVDLDGKHFDAFREFKLAATRIWHNLQGLADRVDVHVSTGQKGLHFIAWFRDELEFADQLKVRRANGDDPRRTDMDRQRWEQLGGRFTDVLFQSKGNAPKAKERRFRDVYDALDYIEAQRDDYQRMKRLANHGHRGAPRLAARQEGRP